MPISKQDFIAIANCINAARPVLPRGQWGERQEGWDHAATFIAERIADYCKAANPNFKRNTFLVACGVK